MKREYLVVDEFGYLENVKEFGFNFKDHMVHINDNTNIGTIIPFYVKSPLRKIEVLTGSNNKKFYKCGNIKDIIVIGKRIQRIQRRESHCDGIFGNKYTKEEVSQLTKDECKEILRVTKVLQENECNMKNNKM